MKNEDYRIVRAYYRKSFYDILPRGKFVFSYKEIDKLNEKLREMTDKISSILDEDSKEKGVSLSLIGYHLKYNDIETSINVYVETDILPCSSGNRLVMKIKSILTGIDINLPHLLEDLEKSVKGIR